jgi:hypothetical protein
MKMSRHAEKRCQQRALPPEILDIVMKHGRLSDAPGDVCKLFFGNKEYTHAISDLKKMMKRLERARGGTIVLGKGQIVTVYKQY